MNTNQGLLLFERQTRHAAHLAKLAIIAAIARPILAAERAKNTRKREREWLRRQKNTNQTALCGINIYFRSMWDLARGCHWRTCTHCGKPLCYYDTYEEAKTHNTQPCERPR